VDRSRRACRHAYGANCGASRGAEADPGCGGGQPACHREALGRGPRCPGLCRVALRASLAPAAACRLEAALSLSRWSAGPPAGSMGYSSPGTRVRASHGCARADDSVGLVGGIRIRRPAAARRGIDDCHGCNPFGPCACGSGARSLWHLGAGRALRWPGAGRSHDPGWCASSMGHNQEDKMGGLAAVGFCGVGGRGCNARRVPARGPARVPHCGGRAGATLSAPAPDRT